MISRYIVTNLRTGRVSGIEVTASTADHLRRNGFQVLPAGRAS